MKKNFSLALAVVAAWAVGVVALADDKDTGSKPEVPPAVEPTPVEQARGTVKLLDNVYKQTIVLITEKYVHDDDDFPAGSAAVELFRRIAEGGSHHVRLIDVTGDPYEPENVAQSDFEKEAVKKIKEGAEFYERVHEKDGKRVLQAMTPVPVVLQKCVMCHSHYADAKPGEAIGALSYEIPLP